MHLFSFSIYIWRPFSLQKLDEIVSKIARENVRSSCQKRTFLVLRNCFLGKNVWRVSQWISFSSELRKTRSDIERKVRHRVVYTTIYLSKRFSGRKQIFMNKNFILFRVLIGNFSDFEFEQKHFSAVVKKLKNCFLCAQGNNCD